jgi:hypothetical protein
MGGGREGRLQGVEVRRRAKNDPGDRRTAEVRIRRICLRYDAGRRACFVPEAGEEFFSQDDAHRLVGMLHTGSEDLEWGLMEPERFPGEAPYDTGAV